MANNPEEVESGLLEGALKDLEQAEDHLAHARKDELVAEHEIEEAIDKIKEAEHDRLEVVVHVVHVNEAEKASFKEKVERTLQAVWDRPTPNWRSHGSPRTSSRLAAITRNP